MNASWEGCTKLIEAQDRRIAELKKQIESLNKQLDFALKTGDARWNKEHAKLNDLWDSEEDAYVVIPEYSAAEAFSTYQEALDDAEYYQRQHERCAIVRICDMMEVKENEADEYSDPRADKIMYDESWRDAV